MASPLSSRIKILQIPNGLEHNVVQVLAQKLSVLRLEALLISPSTFTANHATEAAFPASRWEERILDPRARHSIAVVCSPSEVTDQPEAQSSLDHVVQALLDGTWVGNLVLVGPSPPSTTAAPTTRIESAEAASEQPIPEYHLNGMFVAPSHRGLGLGTRLVDSALQDLAGSLREQEGKRARVNLIVTEENDLARRMYEKCGFVLEGGTRRGFADVGEAGGLRRTVKMTRMVEAGQGEVQNSC